MLDESLGCLLSLVCMPYHVWKATRDRSILGESPMDCEAGRFWWHFAWVATGVLLVGWALAEWLPF